MYIQLTIKLVTKAIQLFTSKEIRDKDMKKVLKALVKDPDISKHYFCGAICTKSKRACMKEVKKEGMHCYVHDPERKCQGRTNGGAKCGSVAKTGENYCWRHRDQGRKQVGKNKTMPTSHTKKPHTPEDVVDSNDDSESEGEVPKKAPQKRQPKKVAPPSDDDSEDEAPKRQPKKAESSDEDSSDDGYDVSKFKGRKGVVLSSSSEDESEDEVPKRQPKKAESSDEDSSDDGYDVSKFKGRKGVVLSSSSEDESEDEVPKRQPKKAESSDEEDEVPKKAPQKRQSKKVAPPSDEDESSDEKPTKGRKGGYDEDGYEMALIGMVDGPYSDEEDEVPKRQPKK
ncbi:hypothetical protein EC991_010686, partial [Linnemannia zychae]